MSTPRQIPHLPHHPDNRSLENHTGQATGHSARDELEETREAINFTQDGEHIGDIMSETKPKNTTRIYFQNINGINWDNAGGRWPYICEAIMTTEVDVACFAELNTNTNQYHIRDHMERICKRQFTHSRLIMAHSKHATTTAYKPGGTAIMAVNSITANIHNHTRDRMGRWASLSFTTKTSRKIRIISAYQVCAGARPGSNTASSQQTAQIVEELRASGLTHMQSPREAFISELQMFIQSIQNAQEEVILVGDFNEEMTSQHSGIAQLAATCGLVDLFAVRLGDSHIPSTYQRGTKRLDFALVSPTILPHVRAAGYDPFAYRIVSDHRGLYIDLMTDAVFNQEIYPLAPVSKREFSSSSPETVRKYVTAKIKYLEDHHFFQRLQRLNQAGEANHDLAESLDRDMQRAAKHAANECSQRARPPWSPKLAKCWATLHFYRLARAHLKNNANVLPAIIQLQQTWDTVPREIPTTEDQIHQGYKTATQQLHAVRREAQTAREEHLIERAIHYEIVDDRRRAKIIRRMLHAEAQTRVYKKLQYLRHQDQGSHGLSQLKVPRNISITDTSAMKDLPDTNEHWETVTIPKEIEQLLLQRNRHHFGQAEGTPFTAPPLQADIGYKGDGLAVKLILQGQVQYENVSSATSLLIKHLQQRTSITLDGTISNTQILGKLKKWKEGTTTSPSGIHLGHYHCMWRKASTDPTDENNDRITKQQHMLLQATTDLLNYAINYKYTYERWRKIVNVMLQKDQNNPRIHRLRVIHIYEADYNLLLAIKWRQAMHNAEDRHLINDGLYGSRPGRNAHDPVMIEVLQHELYRMSMKAGINFDLDASSCYDRILMNVASICSQRMGMHPLVTNINAQTLEQARYHLKTNLGITQDSYHHSPTTPIHGTGQGSGNSPFIWCFVCSALFDALEEKASGAEFESYDKQHSIQISITGFVDDCSQRVNRFSCHPQPQPHDLIRYMQDDAQLWNDILWTSGGALEHTKCSFHLITSEWTSDGHPFLHGATSHRPIRLYNGSTLTEVRQVSNYKAHKTLGCYVNPAGLSTQAFKVLKEHNEKLANLLETNYFTRREAWTYYISFYLPSIRYPLPMTPLAQAQCNQLDTRVLRSLLPYTGYNRNMSRAIRYAPRHMGGANFRPLYIEQGVEQIKMVFKHLNSPQTVIGKLMRMTLSWTQAFLGISAPILQEPKSKIPPVGPSWILTARTFLREIDGQLVLNDTQVAPSLREHDRFIMDIAMNQSRWKDKQLIQINACRRYLQAQTLGDITSLSGTRIQPTALSGQSIDPNKVQISMFNQKRPNDNAWKTWRQFLHTFADKQGVLYRPLGRWILQYNKLRHWPQYVYDPTKDQLYSHVGGTLYATHDRIRSRTFTIRARDTVAILQGYPTAVTILNDNMIPARNYIDSATPSSNGSMPRRPPNVISWDEQILQQVTVLVGQDDIAPLLRTGHIRICSDGSVTHEQGSFGFVIATTTGQRIVHGKGEVPGFHANSFRSEAYGVLGALTWLNQVMNTIDLQLHEPISYVLYLDNRSVINRIETEWNIKYTCPNRWLLPEQDVIMAILHTWRKLPVHITFKWVKGHQDTNVDISQLPLEAQLNCEADQLAGQVDRRIANTIIPILPGTSCQLLLSNTTITGHHKQRIYEQATIPPLLQYLADKYHWDSSTVTDIDWTNFSSTIKKYSKSWTTLVKHVHDISPTGKFAHRNNPTLPHECPACGQPYEDNLHVIICSAPSRRQWRQKLMQSIQRSDAAESEPHLLDILQDGLRRLHQQLQPPDSRHYPERYHALLASQAKIGWHQLYKGRWSVHWQMLQEQYKLRNPAKATIHTGQMWVLTMSRLILDHWFQLWETRNAERHGQDDKTRKEMRAHLTKTALEALYQLKDSVCPVDRQIFYGTVQEHLDKHSISHIEQWIQTYGDAIKTSVEQARKMGIQRNRSILQYSTTNPVSRTSNQASLTAGLVAG